MAEKNGMVTKANVEYINSGAYIRLPVLAYGDDAVTAGPFPVQEMLLNSPEFGVRHITNTTLRRMNIGRYRKRTEDNQLWLRYTEGDYYTERTYLNYIADVAADPDKFDPVHFVIPGRAFYTGDEVVMKLAAIPQSARSSVRTMRRILSNFYYEVAIATTLKHKHIVSFKDLTAIELDKNLFPGYIMERLKPITEYLEGIPNLSVEQVLSIGDQIGEAIDYAHHLGIILWDIKPDSIGMRGDDAVLFDFDATREAVLPWENRKDRQTKQYSDPQQKLGVGTTIENHILRRISYTDRPKAADIHAFGMSLYVLLQQREKDLFAGPEGTDPDGHHSPAQALQPLPIEIPAMAYDVLSWATHFDRDLRPTSCAMLMDYLHQAFSQSNY